MLAVLQHRCGRAVGRIRIEVGFGGPVPRTGSRHSDATRRSITADRVGLRGRRHGVSTAIQDMHNVAWRLNGWTGAGLLDT
jgi:hypothetical protein